MITKKIVPILMVVLMVFTMTSMSTETVYAEEGTPAILLVTDGEAPNIEGAQASYVWFGNYMQSSADTKEPVKWRVLQNADKKLFLLSDQNLDRKQYNVSNTSVTWEDSTIRSWLNDSFKDTIFSTSEAEAVAETEVINDDNPTFGTPGGENTTDKIFFLSIGEATNKNYGFAEDPGLSSVTRRSLNTDYAKMQGAWTSIFGTGEWWLRSPGSNSTMGSIGSRDGNVYDATYSVNNETITVRPAMNLDLESVLFISAATGGKVSGDVGADALKAQSDLSNSGNEWKLTVKDPAREGFFINKTTPTDNSVLVEYSGAKAGTNEYISAIITDKPITEDGAVIKYYGRIAAAVDGDGASVTINTAGKLGKTDYLYVFNEQYNGDEKTDYASELIDTTKRRAVIPTGNTLTYNGNPRTGVAAGTGYTLSGTTSATKAGSYQATATLKEGYVWSDGTTKAKIIKWKINPKAITPTVVLSTKAYIYNGTIRKPTVTVKNGTTKLSATQYDVTYASGRKNVGTYKVTVKMKNNYSGSKTVSFKINPKGTYLTTLTKAKEAATVKWKKQDAKMSTSRITGYQIQLATNSTFTKNKKLVTVEGYSKTTRKVTNLKGGKKYYVRIRTYKKIGTAKYYSPWSKAKTVTTGK